MTLYNVYVNEVSQKCKFWEKNDKTDKLEQNKKFQGKGDSTVSPFLHFYLLVYNAFHSLHIPLQMPLDQPS